MLTWMHNLVAYIFLCLSRLLCVDKLPSHTQSQSVEALNQKYFASTDNDAGLQESPPKKNTVTFKLDTGAQPIIESPVAKSPRSGEQKH